jgi:hypothetical protein
MIGPIPSFRFRIKGKRETYPSFPFFSSREWKKKKKEKKGKKFLALPSLMWVFSEIDFL